MKVRIQTVKPLRVAFIRHVGPYYQVGGTWDRLCLEFGRRGLFGPATKMLGVCYDDPTLTSPEKIRYDACITVGDTFEPFGDIGVQTVAGGDYATLTHFGPYSGLANSYANLICDWLPTSGRSLRSAPCFEIYLNSPANSAPPELVTELYVPLEPL